MKVTECLQQTLFDTWKHYSYKCKDTHNWSIPFQKFWNWITRQEKDSSKPDFEQDSPFSPKECVHLQGLTGSPTNADTGRRYGSKSTPIKCLSDWLNQEYLHKSFPLKHDTALAKIVEVPPNNIMAMISWHHLILQNKPLVPYNRHGLGWPDLTSNVAKFSTRTGSRSSLSWFETSLTNYRFYPNGCSYRQFWWFAYRTMAFLRLAMGHLKPLLSG